MLTVIARLACHGEACGNRALGSECSRSTLDSHQTGGLSHEVVEVVGVRDDVYVTNTLFRLDRRTGFGFLREALNPAGDKLRRESALQS